MEVLLKKEQPIAAKEAAPCLWQQAGVQPAHNQATEIENALVYLPILLRSRKKT